MMTLEKPMRSTRSTVVGWYAKPGATTYHSFAPRGENGEIKSDCGMIFPDDATAKKAGEGRCCERCKRSDRAMRRDI